MTLQKRQSIFDVSMSLLYVCPFTMKIFIDAYNMNNTNALVMHEKCDYGENTGRRVVDRSMRQEFFKEGLIG